MFNTEIESIYNSIDVIASLDRISNSEGKTISIIPFGCVSNMFDRVTEKVVPNRAVTKLMDKENLTLFKLEAYLKKNGELKTEGKFLLYKISGYSFIYLAICLEESEFFHSELRPFIKSFHSDVILPFIKSKELIRLIESYQSVTKLTEIKIKRASQKIRYHEENSMSTVTWNNSSIEEAYDWLKENNGFFKSIQFRGYRSESEVSNVFFDRRGITRSNRNFMKIFESLIIPVIDLLDKYIILFNKRGRRDNEMLKAKPLAISFSEEKFSKVENHKKFIEIISNLSDTSVSILHGNPYIHLSIVDYIDASTYDLWVVDNNRILLVPQLRSTIISIKRIVNHIFDNYAEGEVSNYENQYR